MKPNKHFSFLKEKITSRQILSFIGITCLFLLLRWNSFTTPFERDEGEYAYAARLLHHGVMPYEHSFMQKPPMIIYAYLFGQLISENSIVLPRALASLSVFLTIIVTGIIVARGSNNFLGLTVMWALTPMVSFPPLHLFAANTEAFMILPMMLVFLLVLWKKGEAPLLHWFLGGCFGAIACLFKPIAAPVLVFMVFLWQVELWKSTKRFSVLLKHTGIITLGVSLTTLLFLLPFLLHDGGKTLRECVIDYNLLYTSFDEYDYSPILSFLTLFWKQWWFICLLFAWYIIKRPPLWWQYLGLVFISLLTIYRSPIGHYYLVLLPFLAIISVASLDSLFTQLKIGSPRGSVRMKSVVISVLILLLLLPNYDLISKSPNEFIIELYTKHSPFIEAQIAAKKVEEITQPSDKIFIAGSEPEVLYYANRESVSRFVIVYPLMIPTAAAQVYQEEVVQTLQKNLPEVIVYVQSPASWMRHKKTPAIFVPYIDELVKTKYSLVGGTLFDIKQWIDTPNEKEAKRCSMLIYKRLPVEK